MFLDNLLCEPALVKSRMENKEMKMVQLCTVISVNVYF